VATSLRTTIAERLRRGASSAAELMQALGVSQSTVSRALRDLERRHDVMRIGSTRGARYASYRRVDAIGSQGPIYRIDEEGTASRVGNPELDLSRQLLRGCRSCAYCRSFQGVPYYLQDARPAGFLGRGSTRSVSGTRFAASGNRLDRRALPDIPHATGIGR